MDCYCAGFIDYKRMNHQTFDALAPPVGAIVLPIAVITVEEGAWNKPYMVPGTSAPASVSLTVKI